MKLFELSATFKEIEEILDNIDVDDMTEDDQANMLAVIDKLEVKIEEKAQNIAFLIKNAKVEEDALVEEIKRLQDKKKARENYIARLKEYLTMCLHYAGIEKLKTTLHTFYFQTRASVDVQDARDLDTQFQRITVEANKTEIMNYYKENNVVPKGAEIKDKKSLVIR